MATSIIPPALQRARADNKLATIDRAREYVAASQASATRRAYASDWRDFIAYCSSSGSTPLPAAPETVALYVTELADRAKVATVRRRLAAIAQMHKERSLTSPCAHEIVRRLIRGIVRTKGRMQTRKSAATLDHVRAMLLEIHGDDVKAKRDRAILLLGFAAALRRSELAALEVDDLRFEKRGLVVTIRNSKTDQESVGEEIAVPYVPNTTLCAARAVGEWLNAAGVSSGPVFRSYSLAGGMQLAPISGRDVANLVKKLARKARLDGDFSGHSLRAGFVTSAARARVSLDAIARTTRHRSLAVLMGYVRPAQIFDDSALAAVIA